MNKCKRQFYNKVAAVLVCVAATCLFFACSRDDDDDSSKEKTEKPQPGFEVAKSRTVMVYIAADNSLDTNVTRDVTEILKGFSKYDLGAGCRMVVFVDAGRGNPKIYALEHGFDVTTNGSIAPVKTYASDVNSASADVLAEFVDYAMSHYPADSYGLVLGSHGFGWIPSYVRIDPKSKISRAFGTDDTTGKGRIGMGTDEIANVLSARGGVDFVFFDACFMQTIEVACDLMDVAKHIIASPAEVPLSGADYSTAVPEMFRDKGYSEAICEAYNNVYLHDEDGGAVISCIDTDSLQHFIQYMRQHMANLADSMDYVDVDALFSYHKYPTVASFYPDMPDMQSVMKHLLDENEFAEWCVEAKKAVKCWHGSTWYDTYRDKVGVDDGQCSGVSMFVPRSVYDSYGAYFNAYYMQTRWAKMLWGKM